MGSWSFICILVWPLGREGSKAAEATQVLTAAMLDLMFLRSRLWGVVLRICKAMAFPSLLRGLCMGIIPLPLLWCWARCWCQTLPVTEQGVPPIPRVNRIVGSAARVQLEVYSMVYCPRRAGCAVRPLRQLGRTPLCLTWCLWGVELWSSDCWKEGLIIYPECFPETNPDLQNALCYWQEHHLSSPSFAFQK